MKKEKGFTLIELLVVVSVIAILASTVLVNLRGARERAMDTRVISSLGQVRAVAEIIHSRTGSYTDLCGGGGAATGTLSSTTPDGLNVLRADIDANNGTVGGAPAGIPVCHVVGTEYCVLSTLNETPTTFWCINSAGRSARILTTTTCTSAITTCL